MNISGQNEQGGPRERTPLRSGRHQTSYGTPGPVPRPPDHQPPPPYTATQDPCGREYPQTNNGYPQSAPSPFPHPQTNVGHPQSAPSFSHPHNLVKYLVACTAIFFFLVPIQFVAFIFSNNIPTKIGQYNEARAKMHEQEDTMRKEAEHLENERTELSRESTRLAEERERWEKARDELTIPKGAFWEVVWPAWDCRAYGKREYWGILRNIPEGRSEMDACMNMPVEIKGVTVRRPYRCKNIDGSIRGFWMVDWDQPDCKPWHLGFVDRGCTNQGSGLRHIETGVAGFNNKGGQDWRLLCETMPMTWDHIKYTSPTYCDDRGVKFAVWYVPDDRC